MRKAERSSGTRNKQSENAVLRHALRRSASGAPAGGVFVFAGPSISAGVRMLLSKILPHNRKRRFSYPPPHIAGRPHAALREFPHADHSARRKASDRTQKKNPDGIGKGSRTTLTGAARPSARRGVFVFAGPPDIRAPRSKILPHTRKRRFSYPPPHIAGRPHAALREFPHADHSARQKAPRPQKKNTDGIRMTLTGAARPSGGARPARGPQPEYTAHFCEICIDVTTKQAVERILLTKKSRYGILIIRSIS